ncbi:UNVERIFIED_ORG: hypothetical protein QOE_1752 [Clostridioides difficile F501]
MPRAPASAHPGEMLRFGVCSGGLRILGVGRLRAAPGQSPRGSNRRCALDEAPSRKRIGLPFAIRHSSLLLIPHTLVFSHA